MPELTGAYTNPATCKHIILQAAAFVLCASYFKLNVVNIKLNNKIAFFMYIFVQSKFKLSVFPSRTVFSQVHMAHLLYGESNTLYLFSILPLSYAVD